MTGREKYDEFYGIDLNIIENDSNIGLGRAINKALKQIDTGYVLISGFDVVYDSAALEEFLNEAEKIDDNVAGLAPKIKFSYQRNFIESVGTYPVSYTHLDVYKRQKLIMPPAKSILLPSKESTLEPEQIISSEP